ncbi:MAG: ferritin family protein [Methanobacterium sp.]|nr:ferritin family protein [Methanobacterium sp.]
MELINEHEIGVCKGTAMEKDVKANFEGECAEVGMYLAMARLAQREGLPEVGEVLKTIAYEEAGHAAVFAEMNSVISSSLKDNLEMMLKGETMANNEKKASAKKAKVEDIDPAHDFFDESSKDEARHARMLKGILERYF